MEMSGQLHAPADLPCEKYPMYPMNRDMGGSQRRYGH